MSIDARSPDEFSATLEPLVFGGSPSEDVTEFLGAVKRMAVLHGRHDDDTWIIAYAESCLRRQALRWFDVLPAIKTDSWSELRRAFLQRFESSEPPAAAPAAQAPIATVPASAHISRLSMLPNAPFPSEIQTSFKGSNSLPPSKIILLGDSGVGKSCLLTRHLGFGWTPSTEPTLGVRHETIAGSYDGKKYQEIFWDTSGAASKNLIVRYLEDITTIWIVYDVTNEVSFANVGSWHQLVKQHAFRAVDLRLIGNKIDLRDRRVVQEPQGRGLAQKLGIPRFYETSARTNEGIMESWRGWLPSMAYAA